MKLLVFPCSKVYKMQNFLLLDKKESKLKKKIESKINWPKGTKTERNNGSLRILKKYNHCPETGPTSSKKSRKNIFFVRILNF